MASRVSHPIAILEIHSQEKARRIFSTALERRWEPIVTHPMHSTVPTLVISKPDREVGRPGRGGYSLQNQLADWTPGLYETVRAYTKKEVLQTLQPSKPFTSQNRDKVQAVVIAEFWGRPLHPSLQAEQAAVRPLPFFQSPIGAVALIPLIAPYVMQLSSPHPDLDPWESESNIYTEISQDSPVNNGTLQLLPPSPALDTGFGHEWKSAVHSAHTNCAASAIDARAKSYEEHGVHAGVAGWFAEFFNYPAVRTDWLKNACENTGLCPSAHTGELIQELEKLFLRTPLRDTAEKGSGLPANIASSLHTGIFETTANFILEVVGAMELGTSAFDLDNIRMHREKAMHKVLHQWRKERVRVTPAMISEAYSTLPPYPCQTLELVLTDGFIQFKAYVEGENTNLDVSCFPIGTKVHFKRARFLMGTALLDKDSFALIPSDNRIRFHGENSAFREALFERMLHECKLCYSHDESPVGLYLFSLMLALMLCWDYLSCYLAFLSLFRRLVDLNTLTV
ncbi:hypothetical protein BKA70DRAFT_1448183 [Coprinopsis sp. MPI-PUGE-AT-0042]|nr:hypothetical protein BKA70DRAFT_1448183 [Coprinopsis sp. MPI-PUGE-AT-0042]